MSYNTSGMDLGQLLRKKFQDEENETIEFLNTTKEFTGGK